MSKIIVTDDHKEVMYGMSLNQAKDVDRIYIYTSHSLFKVDIASGMLTKAEYKIVNNSPKFNYEPGYLYIPALNENNAQKKFARILVRVDRNVKENKESLSNPHISFYGGDEQINSDKPDTNTE